MAARINDFFDLFDDDFKKGGIYKNNQKRQSKDTGNIGKLNEKYIIKLGITQILPGKTGQQL